MVDLQVQQVIAFIFKRSGKKKMKGSDFYLTISMELNWCPPHIAKSFVSKIEKTSLISKEKDFIMPSFNIDKIQIPIDFKPSIEFFQEFKVTGPEKMKLNNESIIDLIKIQSKLSEEEIQSSIHEIQQQKKVVKPIALLMLAKKQGIDITEYIDTIEQELFIKNKE
jgi:hypothetical protein